MKRKLLLLLIPAMLYFTAVSSGAAVFYDVSGDYGKAAEDLAAYGIVSGRESGLFYPDDYVKRCEFAKMAVISADADIMQYTSGLFYDVDAGHWAGAYINAAAKNKLITGYPGGGFMPENNITYAEAVTVVLRVLGYGSGEIGNNYPAAYLEKARELGLTAGLSFDGGEAIDRKNTALIFSRALMLDKNGTKKKLIEQLDFKVSDECVILPAYLTASDEVPTSDGIYKSLVNTDAYVGKRVKLVLDRDSNIAAVLPVSGNVEVLTVQSNTDGNIGYTRGSEYGYINPDNSAKTYYQNTEYTFSAVKSEITAGMKLMACKNDAGRIDHIIIYENKLNGPYIIETTLAGAGIDTAGKLIMKNGSFCGAEAAEKNNVAYYDDEYVYIYDSKVTGVYERALPYKSDVKSIALSGNEYEIEIPAAAEVFEKGVFAVNDYITLLLGRNGRIAGVQAAADAGDRYPIVSVLENDIVYIKDGVIESMKAENSWRINYNGSETTFGAIRKNNFENALLTVFYNNDGGFDYGVIKEYDLKGPETVFGDVRNIFDISGGCRVVRDGKDADISDIKADDIVYYSDIQNTLYAYCDDKLGVFEEAYPNKANAKSIKLSGVTYEIETRRVLDKLSRFEKNDHMTVLLGKDGKVADIKTTAAKTSDYGILLSCRDGMDDGTRAYYAVFLTDKGSETEYKTDKNYEEYIGRGAELVFENGKLVPEFLKNSTLSGEINQAGRRIGGKYLSDNCVIIDVSFIPDSDQAKDGYPAAAERIEFSGITVGKVSKGQVVSEKYDENGDICFIAFNNITNSRYKYGMVMDYENKPSSSWYDIDIDGSVKRYNTPVNNKVGRVPVMANIQKGRLLDISSLEEIKTRGGLVSLDNERIRIGDNSYYLHKNCVVYVKENRKFGPANIEDLDISGLSSVRIYADRPLERGGVIRIITAEKK